MKKILKILNKHLKKEKGQVLVAVLGLLALGGLTIAPLLTHITTGLNAARTQAEKMALSYAADTGIEYALWMTNNDGIPIDPHDYETEFTDCVPEDINNNTVNITIKQIWPLLGLESDENGTTPPESLLVTRSVINEEEGEYEVQLSYDGSQGYLLVDRVAVWLPSGFDYVTGSASGITTEDPADIIDWQGGKALMWGFDPPVNFIDLELPEPPPGGFTPAVQYPATRVLAYSIYPGGEVADGSYAWIRTTSTDLYLSWETGHKIYNISSTAINNTTGRRMTVKGYTYVSQRFLAGGGGSGGSLSLLTGDYRAIGNTMMEDTNYDRRRETFFEERSATVSNIPEDAEVAYAYLYWSGWREWVGEMAADRYIGLKVDDRSVYFNEQGVAVEGELETEPAIEILRPNASGSYTECDYYGASSNYRCVKEPVADEGTTYVETSAGAVEIDTYNLSNRSAGNGDIASVTVHVRSRGTDTPVIHAAEVAIRTHSTNYFCSYTLLPLSYTDISATWLTNPYTGSAWTWAEVNALQAGVRQRDNGAGYVRTTQVYVEVNYTPLFQGVEASRWWLLENSAPNYAYSCFRDVTELVKLISPDGNATYTITGVAGNTDSELSYAGWSMIIIYSSPTEEAQQFYLYDCFLNAPGGSSHTFIIAGFKAPDDAEAALTCFVGEGDEHYIYDYIEFNDNYLSDAINPQDNVWNGRSSGLAGESIDGVDIDTFDVSSPLIEGGDTSAEVTLTTDVDQWNLIYIVLAFRSEVAGLTPNSIGIISYNYAGGA